MGCGGISKGACEAVSAFYREALRGSLKKAGVLA